MNEVRQTTFLCDVGDPIVRAERLDLAFNDLKQYGYSLSDIASKYAHVLDIGMGRGGGLG